MRKADLIDAILAAANGGDAPATPRLRQRRRPSPRPSRAGPLGPRVRAPTTTIAALAAEEDALAPTRPSDEPDLAASPARARSAHRRATGDTADDRAADGGRRRRTTRGDDADPASRLDATPTATPTTATRRRRRRHVDPEDERQSYGDGNRRGRRRRRGRGGQDQQGGERRAASEYQGEPIACRACSTCATRATASCARAATSPGRERRLRVGVAGAAVRAAQGRLRQGRRRARRRATRSTRRCCASTRSTA